MNDLRVEVTDDGAAIYLAVDPDGLWVKTTQPDELITIDWDRQGRVIGIEAIGSVARSAIDALIASLRDAQAADPQALHDAIDRLIGGDRASTHG